ncbi:hypothetical protein ABVN80_19525 [Acinetobacter baumannii]
MACRFSSGLHPGLSNSVTFRQKPLKAGAIDLVEDGDTIEIDIPNRTIIT